jgi:hypothetical protein
MLIKLENDTNQRVMNMQMLAHDSISRNYVTYLNLFLLYPQIQNTHEVGVDLSFIQREHKCHWLTRSTRTHQHEI